MAKSDQVNESPTQKAHELTPERLFELASPAVVKLIVKDEDGREIGQGSGFIVAVEKAESWQAFDSLIYRSTIVTNYHVIRPAVDIDIVFHAKAASSQDQPFPRYIKHGWVTEVAAEDERADLAVLIVESRTEPTQKLKLHDGAIPPVGAKVYAIGSPLGLGNTLSEGLVSAHRKRGRLPPWIQITAPISPGSSGGPVLSADGTVLGMTTATIREGQNLNFAIPAQEIRRVLNGPKNPRSVWEGASIRETEREAFATAESAFYKPCQITVETNPKGSRLVTYPSAHILEEHLDTRVREGDQLALLVKGRKLCSDNSYDDAVAMLRRATEAKPGEFAHLAYLALAHATRLKIWRDQEDGRPWEPVIDLLKRAKELNPDFAPTVYSLTDLYAIQQKWTEVLLAANDLVRLMPRFHEAYQFRGTAWALLGRAEAFERDFDTAYKLRPNDPDLIRKKGFAYVESNNDRKAVETYKQAIELDEGCVDCHFNIGLAYERMGAYSEAIKSYQEALDHGGFGNETLDLHIQYTIAVCHAELAEEYEKTGDYAEAIKSYQAALDHGGLRNETVGLRLLILQKIAECRRRLNQLP